MLKPVFDQCLLEKEYVQGDFFTTTYDDMRENLSPLRSDRDERLRHLPSIEELLGLVAISLRTF